MLLRGARVGKGSVKREGLLRERLVSDRGSMRTAGLHEDVKPQFGERAQEWDGDVVGGVAQWVDWDSQGGVL